MTAPFACRPISPCCSVICTNGSTVSCLQWLYMHGALFMEGSSQGPFQKCKACDHQINSVIFACQMHQKSRTPCPAVMWPGCVSGGAQLQECTCLDPNGILTSCATGPGGSSVDGLAAWQHICLRLRSADVCLLCVFLARLFRVGVRTGLQGQSESCRT